MVGAQYDYHYQINTQLTIGCFTNPPTKSHEANRYSPVNLELSYLKIKMHEALIHIRYTYSLVYLRFKTVLPL